MAKTIVLDGVQRGVVTIWKVKDAPRVTADYQIRSGSEVVKSESREVTDLLTEEQKSTISLAYDAIFSAIEQSELS